MARLHPGQRVIVPRLYADQQDVTATVVRVVESTRQLWVRYDGDDAVREISTFHAHPLPDASDSPRINEEDA